jgi:Arc/MetJ-type ribon-helix-helix transcriptional regulator
MRAKPKSAITLPPKDLRLVLLLQARLKIKSRVEVVRRGLRLLLASTDRAALRGAYRRASRATRASLGSELVELDHFAAEGIEESPGSCGGGFSRPI